MQPLKRCCGLDAEFFAQLAARVSKRSQRICLTAGSVERQHEQAVQPLSQWVLGYQIPQLRDRVAVVADRQLKLDAFLDDADARLLHPVALRVQEWTGQTVAHRSTTEPQRRTQRLGSLPHMPR